MKKILIILSGYEKLYSTAMLGEYESVSKIKRNQCLFFILKAEGFGDE